MTDPLLTIFERDAAQLAARGLRAEHAAQQLRLLRHPPPPLVLDRPATVGDGIESVPDVEADALAELGASAATLGRVSKFVPASGAATRMFQDLQLARDEEGPPSRSPAVRTLLSRLDELAFGAGLRARAGVADAPRAEEDERRLLDTLLDVMGYAGQPKGLIPFHRSDPPRSAFEEHLREGVRYLRSADGRCRVHFTVAEEWQPAFEAELARVRPAVEAAPPGCRLDVTFSVQHPSTDTLAIDESGQPARAASGELLFRPGGHGALLRNLQEVRGDIVVLKNIDNVLPAEATDEVARWKRILVGHLVRLQDEVFSRLERCLDPRVGERELDEALAFAERAFGRYPAGGVVDHEARRRFARAALDRPLRVCGVVRNEGEPGGAPFWVAGPGDAPSIQIVESSQVNAEQNGVFRSSTHFNPVDVVAGVRRFTGEPFDLSAFVDEHAALVARKVQDGRELTVLERPGLWNGGMAGWNTVCVEVPGSTFAPVKTVLDLLRPQHLVP